MRSGTSGAAEETDLFRRLYRGRRCRIRRREFGLDAQAGDVLRVRAFDRATRRSQTKPDRDRVTLDVETLNARGEVVLRAEDWIAIVRLRRPDAA